MQSYLQDLTSKIPLLSLLIVSLFIFSMENKMYWLLLVPLLFCLVGIYFSQKQLQSYRNLIINMVLLMIMLIIGLSLFLDPQVEKIEQVVLRGVSILFMSFVAVLVVVSSSNKNIYMDILSTFMVVTSFILFFLWVSIENQQMRSIFSIILTIMFMFFLFQYMKSISKRSPIKKQQQVFVIGNSWQTKKLEINK